MTVAPEYIFIQVSESAHAAIYMSMSRPARSFGLISSCLERFPNCIELLTFIYIYLHVFTCCSPLHGNINYKHYEFENLITVFRTNSIGF